MPRLNAAVSHVRDPLSVLSFLALFVVSLTFLEPKAVDRNVISPTPAISASGIGNPYVNFVDGIFLETKRVGDQDLVDAPGDSSDPDNWAHG